MATGVQNVPQQYLSLIVNAAQALGIPESVVASQIQLESGYNPGAVSPAGAQGFAQFMPSTWAQYGSGSPFNPSDAMQAYVRYMGALLQQEGGDVRKALEAYNAGPGNLGAGGNYASTILANAGYGGADVMQGNPAAVAIGGAGGATPFVAAPTPVLSLDALRAEAPLVAALVQSVPELQGIFQKAVSGGWTPDKFISAVQNSTWWATHSASARQAFALMKSDPATWNQNVTNLEYSIKVSATQLGAEMTQSQLNNLAIDAITNGYDQNTAEIQARMAQFVKPVSGIHFGGAAGDNEMQIRQAFEELGVTLPEGTLDNNLRSIAGGTMSVQDVLASLRTLSQNTYPAYQQQLSQGVNLSQIADPYIQQAQNLLEQGPGQVNIFSPLIKNALQNKVNGKPAPLSLTDFENTVRQQPAWLKTDNARDSVMQTALGVLQDFGFVGAGVSVPSFQGGTSGH